MLLVKAQHQETQNLHQIPLANKETSHQASICAALEFLEAQKTSSTPPLSVHKVAFEFGLADQTLCNAIQNSVPNHRVIHERCGDAMYEAPDIHSFTTCQNGFGYKTPPMGWNPYNAFGLNYNEATIKQQADIIASEGYLEVGYRYINLALADYIHDKGLLFGIYSDAGTNTCGGLPGSLDHENIDALTFVEWGVDYLKYDNCYNQGIPAQQRYKVMGDALKSVTAGKNKTIYYSICEWGKNEPWLWGHSVGGNRTTDDISASWDSIVTIIDSQISITEYGKPGGWNDPDMLILDSNKITYDEQVTHYVFWSAMKAPLLLGYDQDSLGLSVCQVYYQRENITYFDIWTGPLSNGYVASTIEVYDLVKQQSREKFTNNKYSKHGVEFIKLTGGNIIDNNRPCLNYSQSA
ncbi:2082_t:CDS:10 [Dentiscutata erythropus]|uniref:Alpha-galactosidase n=1 Tax=Dentiscutata erythropus TaxID=1348616 RepID=A0A9N8ZIM4_9GLOM|nr:2082_t:CDS:10 [Dentiscutata erythropus]